MTAKELVQTTGALGVDLVGKKILTQRYGEYPGGIAEVTELAPDETAPEIVLNVRHPTFGEIGVFDHEEVSLV